MSDQQQPTGKKKIGPLEVIERVGNALPDPVFLFVIGAVLVMVLSHLAVVMNVEVQPKTAIEVVDAATGETSLALIPKQIEAVDADTGEVLLDDAGNPVMQDAPPERATSLLTRDGFYWAIRTMTDNFINFAPLGVVLVGMLGIGVAEKTGLLAAVLKLFMLVVPKFALTPTLVFLGIMSSLGSDAGYIVLPPLAAALYKSIGRSPLVGIAAVFAGVAAGFNANLLVTSLDPLLANLSTIGANVIDPDYVVAPTSNWMFMIASTFIITMTGWAITSLVVERRYKRKPADEGGPAPMSPEELDSQRLRPEEIRAVMIAGAVALIVVAITLALILIPNAPLHGPGFAEPPTGNGTRGLVPGKTNNLTDFFDRWVESIVPLLFLGFVIPGLAYGVVMKNVRNTKDAAKMMIDSMADMAPIVVLAFFAGQFIAYFGYSNIGRMLAMAGGELLFTSGLPGPMLILAFILVTAVFNMFVGSMSAKYTLFAPIFIPMLMFVGISPELTQAAYRIGDSITNIITPLNAYLVIVLVFMQKHCPKGGMGTLIAMMFPYTVGFGIVWSIMIVVWMTFDLPLGIPPETGPLTYQMVQ
ncbi:MAG: AbgT family transporter [Planctomycetota bacterium]